MAAVRSRAFEVLLYPDAENYDYNSVYTYIDSTFRYAACVHDSDFTPEGILKKPHVHVILYFENARSLESVSKDLWYSVNLPRNYVIPSGNLKKSVRYLIHLDDPDKYQYPKESIVSNFDISSFLSGCLTESQAFDFLRGQIDSGNVKDVHSLVSVALDNDMWSVLRRNYSILTALMAENQYLFRQQRYHDSTIEASTRG